MYYDPDGRPLELMEWATLFELRSLDPDDSWWRRQSRVPGGLVSTVWAGIDQSFGWGEPLPWETMIFGCYDLDGERLRQPSRARALAGHRAIVRRLVLGHAIRTLVAAAALAAVVLVAALAS